MSLLQIIRDRLVGRADLSPTLVQLIDQKADASSVTSLVQTAINQGTPAAPGSYVPPVLLSDVVAGTAIPYREGNRLSNMRDPYTREAVTAVLATTGYGNQVLTAATVDGVLCFAYAGVYWKREFGGVIDMRWFGVAENTNITASWFTLLKALPTPPDSDIYAGPTTAKTLWPRGVMQMDAAMVMGRRAISMTCESGSAHIVFNNSINLPKLFVPFDVGNAQGYHFGTGGIWISYDNGKGTDEITNFIFDGSVPIGSAPVSDTNGNPSAIPDDYNAWCGVRVNAVWKFSNVISQQWKGHAWWIAGNVGFRIPGFVRTGWDASRCKLVGCAGRSTGGAAFYIGGSELAVSDVLGTEGSARYNQNVSYDANQIAFNEPDARDCRWGLVDSSFLGIQVYGGHGNNNTLGHLWITNINNATRISGWYEEDGNNQPPSRIIGRCYVDGRFTQGAPTVTGESAIYLNDGASNKVATSNFAIGDGGKGMAFFSTGVMYLRLVKNGGPGLRLQWINDTPEPDSFELVQSNANIIVGGTVVRNAQFPGLVLPSGYMAGGQEHRWFNNFMGLGNQLQWTWKPGDLITLTAHDATLPRRIECVAGGKLEGTVVFIPLDSGVGTLAQRPDVSVLRAHMQASGVGGIDPTSWRYYSKDEARWYTCTGTAWI